MYTEFSKILRRGRSPVFRLLSLVAIAIVAVAIVAIALPQSAAAQAVRGEISVEVENGFARFVLLFGEEVETKVRVANNILTISFEKQVDIAVDRISAKSGGYVSAARRDPDGKAIRMALKRKVTMNSIVAAERVFVDLLPEGWTGMLPGLPREIIEDLARRAREAEKRNRQQRALERQQPSAPVRVRVAMQPTFTRYVFEMPALTAVTADKAVDKLTLTFDGAYKFDLGDAVAALPPMVASIHSELDRGSTNVRFDFSDKVDVRTFREDNSYIVDVSKPETKAEKGDGNSDELSELAAELAARAKRPDDTDAPETQPAKEPSEKGRPAESQPAASRPAATPPPAASPPAASPPAASSQPAAALPSEVAAGTVERTSGRARGATAAGRAASRAAEGRGIERG